MAENTAVAESYTAPEPQVTELPRSGTAEYAEWRVSGELPKVQPKVEESAPSQADSDASPALPKQEKVLSPAEKRIKELLAENKRLKAERETPKADPKIESKPQLVPQTRTKPTPEDKNADGTPRFKTYEDYTEELADWKAEQRIAEYEKRQIAQRQMEEVAKRVDAAKARYENFDEYAKPFVKDLLDAQDIPLHVKVMVSESEVWPDLVFTIASDAESRAEFLQLAKTQPGKAQRYIAKVESLIQDELAGATTARAENGQFTKTESAPAKRGPESTPEPPLEVGNRGSGTMDESARALSALAKGNPNAVRDWMKAENAKDLRRRRGA